MPRSRPLATVFVFHNSAFDAMNILIEHDEVVDGKFRCFTASAGKFRANVNTWEDGRVNVCVHNSSHSVWRRSGRYFRSIAEALEAYKSAEVRAIILAAAG